MRFFIESYGCTMNHGEAEFFRRKLRTKNHMEVEEKEKADVLIIFTCVVIRETGKRMIRKIKKLVTTGKPLVIAGCIVTGMRERVKSTAPNALLITPSQSSDYDMAVLEKWVENQRDPNLPSSLDMDTFSSLPAVKSLYYRRKILGSKRSTYIVPISQGCLGNCSYCLTKKARGELRSYPADDIFQHVKFAVEKGFKEIQLTSQDTGIYGTDMGTSLPALLDKLSAIKGNHRFRVGMMNPGGLKSALLPMVKSFSSRNVFKFLHLPVQSGDNEILRLMKRGYTVEDFLKIIQSFRKRFPGMTLSTDIIVGFPGEDDEAFGKSMKLIKGIKPDLVNITRYSERPFTSALELKNKVHGRISKKRSRAISILRFNISKKINKEFIGGKFDVVVTKKGKPGSVICRDDNYRTVVIKEDLSVGYWHKVEIVDATEVYLEGEVR